MKSPPVEPTGINTLIGFDEVLTITLKVISAYALSFGLSRSSCC